MADASTIETSIHVFDTWFERLDKKESIAMVRFADNDSAFSRIRVAFGFMTCFAGRTTRGKSALTMQLLYQALVEDPELKAVVLNFEMPPAMILNRLLSLVSGVPASDIDAGKYSFEDPDFARAVDDVMKLKTRLHFVEPPFTIEHVARDVEKYGADIVLLDYIQKIRPEHDYHDPRLNVNAVLDGARTIAAQGKAVIVVSEVTSPGKYTDDSALSLDNLKESAEIGNNCDDVYILKLVRRVSALLDAECLSHAKTKYSTPDDVLLYFDKAYTCFTEEAPCPPSAV